MSTHGADRGAEPAARPAVEGTTGAARLGRLASRLAAVALVAAAGAWAYHANVVAGRPAMDMSTRVTSGTAPFPVEVAIAERGPIAGTARYTGSVAPFNEEDIYPRVTGRIVEMPVYPGDAVRPGQLLARLDDVELGSRVQEAAAAARAAAASVAQMEADVAAAGHGVVQMERELAMAAADLGAARTGVSQMEQELSMVEAETGYQEQVAAREERLFRSGAVARQDVESARAMAAAARAKREAARARLEQAGAMVTSAGAKVEAARARLEQARAMEAAAFRRRDAMAAMAAQSQAQLQTAEVVRDYVDIRASSPGYVVKRLVAPGVLVQPGMAILKLAQIDRVRLQAHVAEQDLPAIRVGAPVTVSLAGTGQVPFAARVTSIFPFVDPGARTAVVEALADNPGRRLLPGQYVAMEFVTGERASALVVPRIAVRRTGGPATVWVVREDRAQPVAVATGLENPERAEVTGGLEAGERVVVRGHEGLYAGARVDASRPAAAPPEPGSRRTPLGSTPSGQPKEGGHGGHN